MGAMGSGVKPNAVCHAGQRGLEERHHSAVVVVATQPGGSAQQRGESPCFGEDWSYSLATQQKVSA